MNTLSTQRQQADLPAAQRANLRVASENLERHVPRFEQTGCSQCGQCFGPGDHGFSTCSGHRSRPAESLNDDDIYIVNTRTRSIRSHIPAGSLADSHGRAHGFPCPVNHGAFTGLHIRLQGLVS